MACLITPIFYLWVVHGIIYTRDKLAKLDVARFFLAHTKIVIIMFK